ncbi:unnamed protein product [Eruca vesicaria subsp. sativa]|uniref:BZIP domain-containing protein n=1 Tax=Eruca vesicaria subsp. sativa TaxID=29727 RepID=A0ABC8JIA6_ERUVS|nr:unnamed protein product [Eruca vesicaria subsp. sativa]
MGSRMNFVDVVSNEVFNPKQPMIGTGLPLTRQNSVFSLTFDEFQNSWGGEIGKEFGSMNMDELLKNIWTAEESHSIMANNINRDLSVGGGGLERQGSVTLPRTVSQKRVDDVWKELMKEDDTGVPQRQQTLGEMTLEEFLLKVGVVREEPQQQVERVDKFNGGFFGLGSDAGLSSAPNGFGPNQPHGAMVRPDLLTTQTHPMQLQQPQQQIQKHVPKQTTIAFSNTVDFNNRSQLPTQCQEVKPLILGVQDRPMNNNLLQAVDFKTGVNVAAVSPGSKMSPDLTPKSNMDASLPPVPYIFGRGRKTGAVLEKVIERRQKRMIKNRESAARSRARKQAYTCELEAEVAQLKEMNEELHKKQVCLTSYYLQIFSLLEPMHQPLGCKRQCLRRTSTGPW